MPGPRVCESCGVPIVGRPAKRFCSDRCRKREANGVVGAFVPPPVDGDGSTARGLTVDAVWAELEAAGRLETYQGRAALALAARIDESTAVMGFAALVKQLHATMAEATAGTKAAADPVDELRSRRDRKQYAG